MTFACLWAFFGLRAFFSEGDFGAQLDRLKTQLRQSRIQSFQHAHYCLPDPCVGLKCEKCGLRSFNESGHCIEICLDNNTRRYNGRCADGNSVCKFTAAKFHTSGDVPLDCDIKSFGSFRQPPKKFRGAVIVPFPQHQTAKVRAWLESMESPGHRPCTVLLDPPFDLVFQTTNLDVQSLTSGLSTVQKCFGNLKHLAVPDGRPQKSYHSAPLVNFEYMMRMLRYKYDFVFLMEIDTHPIKDDWLHALYRHCLDPQPFWVKGSSPASLDEKIQHITDGNAFDADTLHINGNALYALWDPAFHEFLALVFSDITLLEAAENHFDVAIAYALHATHCRVKLFSPLYVHSRFIVSKAKPLNHAILSSTFFAHQSIEPKDCEAPTRGEPSVNCDYLLYVDSEVQRARYSIPARPTIAIVMPFVAHQAGKLFAKLESWDGDMMPCNATTTIDIVLQSEPAALEHIKSRIAGLRGIQKCFRNVIPLPYVFHPNLTAYVYGPPTLFYHAMFSSVFDADYMFLMEPDVYPVRPMWLHMLQDEVKEEFWVKGSLSWYADHDDGIGGFVSSNHAPLGLRLLHINGNALYNRKDPELLMSLIDAAEYAAPQLAKRYKREDRMECFASSSSYSCHGSFDTSIAEYLYSHRTMIMKYIHMYRPSFFVLNDPDFSVLPPGTDIPETTLFIHKPRCGSRIPARTCVMLPGLDFVMSLTGTV